MRNKNCLVLDMRCSEVNVWSGKNPLSLTSVLKLQFLSFSDICRLPQNTGPCRGAFPRFFYNVTSQTCTSFIYGGCQGNGNNFQSQEDCNNACSGVTGKIRSLSCQRSELCEAEYEQGPCRASIKRWYYNKETGICQTFYYGGCKGNKNNYMDENQCKSTCTGKTGTNGPLFAVGVSILPSSKKIPEDDTGSGMCRGAFPRFYYDSDSASCKTFIYGGCGGNDNKFESEEECMSVCSGTGGLNMFSIRLKQRNIQPALDQIFNQRQT
uniref:BPTI/Kunitz inhibitor domain-containing protein n=1 Tax=Xiphophorus couchianus TaxID=32473 RepID=A0A3B5LXV3_9TELE